MKVAVTREELVALAQKCRAAIELPPGYNVVIVVTDESGAWVGVSGSADFSYTQQMLQCATYIGEQETIDDAFDGLHDLALKVAAGEITATAAAGTVGELCTRFGPSTVRALDDYYKWKLTELRKVKP